MHVICSQIVDNLKYSDPLSTKQFVWKFNCYHHHYNCHSNYNYNYHYNCHSNYHYHIQIIDTYHIKEKIKTASILSIKKRISSVVFFSDPSSLSLKSEKKESRRCNNPRLKKRKKKKEKKKE